MSGARPAQPRSFFATVWFVLTFAWRWSLLLTVPVAGLFLLWVARASGRYLNYGVDFNSFQQVLDLERIGALEARGVLRDVELSLRPRPPAGGLRTISLFIPEAAENALLADLPFSGRHYVDAGLTYPDGEVRDVRVKMRGDHFWHWGGRKQSLRIKTKKKALFERLRAINLNAPKMPDQVSGHLSLHLAHEMGLIAPRTEIVELSINGRNRGIYDLFEQMEELTIRTSRHMPGDLYSGDMVGRNRYTGAPSQLFKNEALWEKIAINNHFDADENAALERLVQLLDGSPSAARSLALADLLDMEEFGVYGAFRSLCQTFHYDNTHNWRLYYDPWRNRLLPVVWDPVGWHRGWRPRRNQDAVPDLITAYLDEVLLQDSAFILARQRAIDRFFEDGLDVRIVEYLDDLLVRVGPAIDRDPGLCYVSKMKTPAEVREEQAKLRAVVIKIFRDIEAAYRTPGTIEYAVSAGDPNTLRLRIDGRPPLARLTLDLERPVDGRITAAISWLGPSGPETVDVSGAVIQQGARVVLDVPLVAQFIRTVDESLVVRLRNVVTVQPATYDLILGGVALEGNAVIGVAGHLGDGTRIGARRLDVIEPIHMTQLMVPVRAVPARTPRFWSGTVVLEGVQTITDDVVIAPGTIIRMAPGASVIFEGRVTAIGTEADRIQVVRSSDETGQWGTFALRGRGADASELAWCEMSFGSGYKVPLSEFSAMFSVHDVDDVIVRDCVFEDSQRSFGDDEWVDDMVHVVYSTIRFERCTFARSFSDALDIDISEAVVDRCRFIDSGNDALDLMTSTVVVRNTKILKSGDKGISVGEDTRAFILNSALLDCLIGVQVKDRSRAIIVNCNLVGNGKGLDAYKKNWRYDSGGFCYVHKSVIEGNESALTADKHSRIMVRDSVVEGPVQDTKSIYLDRTCDDGPKRRAKSRRLVRFSDEERLDVKFFRPYWDDVSLRARGARARQ